MKCTAEGCDKESLCRGLCSVHYMRLRRTGKLTTVRLMGSFWEKVDKGAPDACWAWKGFTKQSGHGLTSMNGLPMHTSRKAWILTHGPIKDGLQVLHRCDNAICCNPAHMHLGTRIDNMIDMWTNPDPMDRHARGRKHVLTDVELGELWKMRRDGALIAECADKFRVHKSTICRYITAVRKEKLAKNRAARLSKPQVVPV